MGQLGHQKRQDTDTEDSRVKQKLGNKQNDVRHHNRDFTLLAKQVYDNFTLLAKQIYKGLNSKTTSTTIPSQD